MQIFLPKFVSKLSSIFQDVFELLSNFCRTRENHLLVTLFDGVATHIFVTYCTIKAVFRTLVL